MEPGLKDPEKVFEFIRKHRRSKANLVLIRKRVSALDKFLTQFMKKPLKVEYLSKKMNDERLDYRKDNVFYELINNIFAEADDTTRDSIFLTALCHEIDKEKEGIVISLYKKRISETLEKYDFIVFDEEAKTLMKSPGRG